MSIPPDTQAGGRRQARGIILAQVAVTGSISVLFAVGSGWLEGLAALVGGATNVVANLYFARRLYAGPRVKTTTESILGFFVGEVVKLFIVAALLTLAIAVFKLPFLPLFVALVATLMTFWLAPLLARNPETRA